MRNILKAGLVSLALITGAAGYSQTDPHFSQYYSYPTWLNPALTGAIDGSYRVTAMYRSQWGGITNPFSTPGIAADITTNKNMSFGLNVMSQRAGSIGYNYVTGYATMAYNGVRFGYQQISMGMALGIINRRFDPSKFQTGDMWNSITGIPTDGSATTTEVLSKTSATAFDAGAGIVYYDGTPGKKANLFLGFSAYHLTQPADPFISGSTSKMPMRFTGHGGVKLSVNEDISITPNVLYMRQGNAQEKMIGAYTQMRVNETTDFLLGANYRVGDAFSPYVGIYYNNFQIGVSYDVNTSNLGKVAGNANNFEISITLIGRKAATAESTPFVCPRL